MDTIYTHKSKTRQPSKKGISILQTNKEIVSGSLKSGSSDNPDNQVNTFHVEHNRLNINNLKPIKVKKFKVIWKNSIEFLFAENFREAEKMFHRLYPGLSALIQETPIN